MPIVICVFSGQTTVTSTLITSCITPWETSAADFGIGIMFAHLESIRNFTRNLALYQRNAQTVMTDSSSRLDELLEDAFRYVESVVLVVEMVVTGFLIPQHRVPHEIPVGQQRSDGIGRRSAHENGTAVDANGGETFCEQRNEHTGVQQRNGCVKGNRGKQRETKSN